MSPNLKLPTAQQWADEFSRQLRACLTADEMALAIERNRSDEFNCHSHDFCDANVCMDDAFRKLTGVSALATNPKLDGSYAPSMDDQVGALWEKAWTLARQQEFEPSE